jgi:2,4-dienoyl-CoA reductase-like NADH-dependent reductase (Old Yellow Enzyme family)
MQIAHAGRQTLESVTGSRVLAPSAKRSPYFRSRPVPMTGEKIGAVIEEFVAAAARARRAGFDGVQLHAAHGYLIHQFLSPSLNDRLDNWGRDRFAFLRETVAGIKSRCGDRFPVYVKLSGADDHRNGMTPALAASYAKQLEPLGVEAVEISYGTMDHALNIFRGGVPISRVLEHNPLFCHRPAWLKALWKRFAFPLVKRRFIPFAENYNAAACREVRRQTSLPLILVGGIRSLDAAEALLQTGEADAVAMCRPFVCEPDLATRFRLGRATRSRCSNCNACAVMCDSAASLQCYRKETQP